ncbi:MAG: bifunctional 3-deoxy-7-phosphoheptulonate synthase/chorismate mutase [Bacillota bacterium]
MNKYDEINKLRKEIDYINIEMLKLLNKRTNIVMQISDLKDISNINYFDPTREKDMIMEILEYNNGPLPNELVKEVFIKIFRASLNFMGINKQEVKMLVNSNSTCSFTRINEVFDIDPASPIIIAGPCAIEDNSTLEEVALFLKKNSIRFIRGGAFKPRTSPYDFQGLGRDGLKMLNRVGKEHGLITVSEIVDTKDVEYAIQNVDIIQIGARNMQNYELLKEVGRSNHPVLLKRGISATINEFICAAEYMALQGNRKILLCERGIRTYETKTRNTLDISCIPIIAAETKLPIIVDLSHSLGRKDIIKNIARAALASGADGIMVEVHPRPELALSDNLQQLNFSEFENMLDSLQNYYARNNE